MDVSSEQIFCSSRALSRAMRTYRQVAPTALPRQRWTWGRLTPNTPAQHRQIIIDTQYSISYQRQFPSRHPLGWPSIRHGEAVEDANPAHTAARGVSN